MATARVSEKIWTPRGTIERAPAEAALVALLKSKNEQLQQLLAEYAASGDPNVVHKVFDGDGLGNVCLGADGLGTVGIQPRSDPTGADVSYFEPFGKSSDFKSVASAVLLRGCTADRLGPELQGAMASMRTVLDYRDRGVLSNGSRGIYVQSLKKSDAS